MHGILLAGGLGTRLFPLTLTISKQLLPVYDKPMIYYPLATLMLAGIRNILLITTPGDRALFQRLLGDGSQWGLHIAFAEQPQPQGIAQALLIGRDFIGTNSVALILGDNIFYGHGLSTMLSQVGQQQKGATIFGYWVNDPTRYGVVELNADGSILSLEEKPAHPRSHYAIPGLYFYDNQIGEIAAQLTPSPRGELEITDVNKTYLAQRALQVQCLGRGIAWLDMGTFDSLLRAANFLEAIENRQGLKIACIEEIAYRRGYITAAQLERLAVPLLNSGYGAYLLRVLEEEHRTSMCNSLRYRGQIEEI